MAYDKEAAKTLQSSKPKDEKFRKHSSSVALFPSPEQLWQQEEVHQRSSTPRGKGKENKPYPWVVGLPLAAFATELSHSLLHSWLKAVRPAHGSPGCCYAPSPRTGMWLTVLSSGAATVLSPTDSEASFSAPFPTWIPKNLPCYHCPHTCPQAWPQILPLPAQPRAHWSRYCHALQIDKIESLSVSSSCKPGVQFC